MESLPEEIIIVILSMLSVKSICRFRCVCKLWYELFKNPKFIKMHLQHAIENNKFSVLLESYTDGYYSDKDVYYSIDFDATSASHLLAVETNLPRETFVPDSLHSDSCNGVIRLYTGNPNEDTIRTICLWNPSIREYKEISTPESYDAFSIYGVCYDWKIDDYKLFKIMANQRSDDICSEVLVCRLGSKLWKNIGSIPCYTCPGNVSEKPIKGIIHWIGNTRVIFSLDIVEEQTKQIQIPSCYLDEIFYSFHDMEVGVLGEELYLSINAIYKNNIDLWVMKDYGVADSWTKIFSLSKDETKFDRLWPLQYLGKYREILLQVYVRLEDEDIGEDALISYDPVSGSFMTLDIPGIPKNFHATTFVGSLVSLNSSGSVKATKY